MISVVISLDLLSLRRTEACTIFMLFPPNAVENFLMGSRRPALFCNSFSNATTLKAVPEGCPMMPFFISSTFLISSDTIFMALSSLTSAAIALTPVPAKSKATNLFISSFPFMLLYKSFNVCSLVLII